MVDWHSKTIFTATYSHLSYPEFLEMIWGVFKKYVAMESVRKQQVTTLAYVCLRLGKLAPLNICKFCSIRNSIYTQLDFK